MRNLAGGRVLPVWVAERPGAQSRRANAGNETKVSIFNI